ncbi:hypothetical protein KQI82_01505 [Oscillibacter sp. MSJ-2]|uniref:Transporter n=1 Tax=Dysosmobacter acutus TaxID=2841504 RepID=A0ABS6F5P1_9FIRM|nr:hypothetical protein [Dysosmobacter acutus]MBU5625609.1 hypothetical protein [Dysosmobacter acutus]
MIRALGISLALTLALELPMAAAWGLRDRWNLTVAALGNVLTNPPVVLLHGVLTVQLGWPVWLVTAALETAAAVVEWQCYRSCGRRVHHPLALSLCANAFSYGAGALLMRLY